MITNGAMLTL